MPRERLDFNSGTGSNNTIMQRPQQLYDFSKLAHSERGSQVGRHVEPQETLAAARVSGASAARFELQWWLRWSAGVCCRQVPDETGAAGHWSARPRDDLLHRIPEVWSERLRAVVLLLRQNGAGGACTRPGSMVSFRASRSGKSRSRWPSCTHSHRTTRSTPSATRRSGRPLRKPPTNGPRWSPWSSRRRQTSLQPTWGSVSSVGSTVTPTHLVGLMWH